MEAKHEHEHEHDGERGKHEHPHTAETLMPHDHSHKTGGETFSDSVGLAAVFRGLPKEGHELLEIDLLDCLRPRREPLIGPVRHS